MKQLLLLLAIACSLPGYSQSPLSPVQIAERNKPGTVMILANFKGKVRVTVPVADRTAIQTLSDSLKGLVASGALNQTDFWHVFITDFCKGIDQYMLKGEEVLEKELNTTMLGSGFIVTPDGYVITNCHVIDENDDETRKNFVLETFKEILSNDIKGVEKLTGRPLTDEEAGMLKDANAWYYDQTMEVGNITKEFKVVIGITGKNGKIVPLSLPAALKVKGDPIPGKDVAILKMTEDHVYPTIRVGNDKNMRVGESVYVLGYPGVATFNPMFSEESISEATLTQGLVSARKNMKGGWEVIQIDAAITHGNSGGPVMNSSGEVVGLATFVSVDEQRQQEVAGMNFIVPTTVVNEFIEKAKIKPEMSDISLAYEQAMDLFDHSRYKKALVKFQEVKGMNKAFPFIDTYLEDTQSRIAKGLDKGSGSSKMILIIGGIVLVVALLLILLLRKKR